MSTSASSSRPAFDRDLAATHYPDLTAYLDKLEKAYRANEHAEIADIDHVDTVIKGLNLADPALKLEFHEFSAEEPGSAAESTLAQRLQQGLGKGESFRAVLDDGEHRLAVSIKCSETSHDASLAVIDSILYDEEDIKNQKNHWTNTLAAMAAGIQSKLAPDAPVVRLHAAFTDTQTQKTLEGCIIFALSAAKKMAAEPAIQALHDRMLEELQRSPILAGASHVPAMNLPASFMKHATSKNAINDYIEVRMQEYARGEVRTLQTGQPNPVADPTAAVNKKGQTLLDRHKMHEIDRADREDPDEILTYSNSYEAKRIEFIRTALAHLTSPEQLAQRR